MIATYAAEDRGIEIRAVAGGYKFTPSRSITTRCADSSKASALRCD